MTFLGGVTARAAMMATVDRLLAKERTRDRTPAEQRADRDAPGTGSLRRALQIIALVSEQPGIGLPALATALGVHKSTVHRVCATLVQAGLLEQGQEGSARRGLRFRLGLWLFVLGSRAVAVMDLKRHAPPILRRLAAQAQLPAYLSLVWNGASICIEEVPGPAGSVWLGSAVGLPQPIHTTATGKLYLAHLPRGEARAHLSPVTFVPLAPNTLTSAEVVLDELRRIAEVGYALNDEETEYDVRYIGVAVRDRQERFIAGVTLGATAAQRTREELVELVPHLNAAAAALGARAGRTKA